MTTIAIAAALLCGDQYQFFYDGKPVQLAVAPVVGTKSDPQPDDLLSYLFTMPLGAERVQRFCGAGERYNELWQEDGTGKRWLVAAVVRVERLDAKYKELPKPKVVNPILSLAPADRKKIRAVRFEHWDQDCAAMLRDLDASKVCLEFRQIDDVETFPKMPAELRHLVIDENSNTSSWRDLSSIAGHRNLLSLSIDLMGEEADLGGVKNLPQLRTLTISTFARPKNADFGALPELRSANLSYFRGLNSVAFAAKAPKLESLRIAHTGVTDLSPLAGHPALRVIDARESKVSKLPDAKLPALQSLKLIGASTADANVAAFRKANPACVVEHKWNALFDQLAGVDRIRVRSGGTCHRDEAAERTLAEETDPAKIRDFLSKVRVDERRYGFHCMCCGEPTFEFYRKGELVAAVGYHHDRSLRWPDGWPSDVLMTTDSARYLVDWLDARVPEIKRQHEEARTAAKKAEEEEKRFLACFPSSIHAAFRNRNAREESIAQAIMQALPDAVERVLACCRSFDVPPGSGRTWNSTGILEQGVLEAFKSTPAEAWRTALGRLKTDEPAFRGAARLWLVYQANELLPESERAEHQLRFARAALDGAQDEIKVRVIQSLASMTDDASKAYLTELLRGKAGRAMVQRDFGEPDLAANAAVSLAFRNVKDAGADIRRLADSAKSAADKDAANAALALLGDPTRFNKSMFRGQSYVTGRAAIAAVERFRGAHGLELLIKEGLQHPWAAVNDEAGEAAQRIIGRSFDRRDRDDKLLEWWNREGLSFVVKRLGETQGL